MVFPKEHLIAVLLALLAAILCATSLLFNGYLGSADALHTMTTRLIIQNNGIIPDSYLPYADVSFTYHYFFHYLVSPVVAVMPFFDYVSLALITLPLVFVMLLLFYWLSKELFGGWRVALLALALLITTKFFYQDFYFGLFPMFLATCAFFVFFISYIKKWRWGFLFLPFAFLVHPIYCSVLIMVFLAYAVLRDWRLNDLVLAWALLGVIAMMASPFLNLGVYFGNLLSSGGGSIFLSFSLERAISTVLGIGVMAFAAFALTALFVFPQRKKLWLDWKHVAFFFAALLFAMPMVLIGSGAELQELPLNMFLVGWTLLAIWFVCDIFKEMIEFEFFRLQRAVCLAAGIGLLFTFVFGGYLQSVAFGTKITPEGAGFAQAFYEYDSEPELTLFLTEKPPAKFAEFANKVPIDATQGWFVPRGIIVRDNNKVDAWAKAKQEEAIMDRIWMDGRCFTAGNIPVKYVVIEAGKYELPDKEPVLERGGFVLYEYC